MTREQMEKQARVVDMMVTMHSILARKYHRFSQALDITILGASTLLVALNFAGTEFYKGLAIDPDQSRLAAGLIATLVFFLSTTSLVVNWKGTGDRHFRAFEALVSLKSEWREHIVNFEHESDLARAEFVRRVAWAMGSLIPVPDSSFQKLKIAHYRKLEMSRLISRQPGSSRWILACVLFIRSNKRALSSTTEEK